MRRILPALALMAACDAPDPAPNAPAGRGIASHPASSGDPAYSLESHAWKHRLLLVFASADHQALRDHRQRWDDATVGAAERDLVHIIVVGDAITVAGEPVRGSARGLRERYRPQGDLTVVLVGKDGTEKRRGPELIPGEVFAAIDAMPMRRREMAQP